MSRYIPEGWRLLVKQRANFRCEYCRLPESIAGFSFEMDHVISLRHGGETVLDNLANSCPICNGNKNSDLGTFIPGRPYAIVRFFNPRIDNWFEHFEVIDGVINGLTDIGIVTTRFFDFNQEQDVILRKKLLNLGLFP